MIFDISHLYICIYIVLYFSMGLLEFGPSPLDFVGTALEVLLYSLRSKKKYTILGFGQIKLF